MARQCNTHVIRLPNKSNIVFFGLDSLLKHTLLKQDTTSHRKHFLVKFIFWLCDCVWLCVSECIKWCIRWFQNILHCWMSRQLKCKIRFNFVVFIKPWEILSLSTSLPLKSLRGPWPKGGPWPKAVYYVGNKHPFIFRCSPLSHGIALKYHLILEMHSFLISLEGEIKWYCESDNNKKQCYKAECQ